LWKVTPLRSLKVQVLASEEALQLSASSPTSSPLALTSVRQSKTQPCAIMIMKLSECVRPSQLSEVLAPARPRRKRPPILGAAATVPNGNIDVAAAAAPAFSRSRRLNLILILLLSSVVSYEIHLRVAPQLSWIKPEYTINLATIYLRRVNINPGYILSAAASPILSTPRASKSSVSQSGSISGTELSNKSV